jgi:peptidoglycan-associated lipoprotein
MSRLIVLLVVTCVCAACGSKPAAKTVVTAPPAAPAPAAVAKPAVAPASPQLGVSADLAAQCQLQLAPAQSPNFDYDQFALMPEDRVVLERVATCITKGPLKGRGLRLVGRADPRGTQEYNLGLGDRRAHTVSAYLARLGVTQAQLATVTRGDIDAAGKDEAGWREDRRVDLVLAN